MSDCVRPRARDADECGEVAFVGGPVQDSEPFWDVAFSRAGNMAASNLILGLQEAGLKSSLVLSVAPIPAWPRGRLFSSGRREVVTKEGIAVRLLPFLNVTPLKQIIIGLDTLLRLLRWGRRKPARRRRWVICFNLTVPPGLFTFIACRLIRVPMVAVLFDVNKPGQTAPASFWFRLDYRLQRWLIPRLDGRVVISEAIMRDFAPRASYLVVEGGLSDSVLRQLGEGPDGERNRNEFVVGFAGSLDRANGITELLGAFRVLRDVGLRLVIAGGGPCNAAVLAAASTDARITYFGQLTHREVLALYRRCDLLVNARLTQTVDTRYLFPSKLLEYCASGVPVLTTRVGAHFERYEPVVYVLEDETAAGLAEAVRKIREERSEDRQSMGKRARRFVIEHMTWPAHGRRIREYLERIACGDTGEPS